MLEETGSALQPVEAPPRPLPGRCLSGTDPGQPPLERETLSVYMHAPVARWVARQSGQRTAEEARGAFGVVVPEVVEGDRNLDQPLHEVSVRPAQAAPEVLQGVVTLEVQPGVELRDTALESGALLGSQRGLVAGRRRDPGQCGCPPYRSPASMRTGSRFCLGGSGHVA